MKWRQTWDMCPEFMTIDGGPPVLLVFGYPYHPPHRCPHILSPPADLYPFCISRFAAQLRSQSCMWCSRQAAASAAATLTELVSGNKLVSSLYWLCCCRGVIAAAETAKYVHSTPHHSLLVHSVPCGDVCSAPVEQSPAGWLGKLHKCQLVSTYRTLFLKPLRRALKRIVIKSGPKRRDAAAATLKVP